MAWRIAYGSKPTANHRDQSDGTHIRFAWERPECGGPATAGAEKPRAPNKPNSEKPRAPNEPNTEKPRAPNEPNSEEPRAPNKANIGLGGRKTGVEHEKQKTKPIEAGGGLFSLYWGQGVGKLGKGRSYRPGTARGART